MNHDENENIFENIFNSNSKFKKVFVELVKHWGLAFVTSGSLVPCTPILICFLLLFCIH